MRGEEQHYHGLMMSHGQSSFQKVSPCHELQQTSHKTYNTRLEMKVEVGHLGLEVGFRVLPPDT